MKHSKLEKSRLSLCLISALLLSIWGMLTGCGEPEPISKYTVNVDAHPPNSTTLQPDLPLLLPAQTYQAQAERNPFFWDPEPSLVDSLKKSAVIHESSSGLIIQPRRDPGSSQPRKEECELAPLPDLILRATFSEHSGYGHVASALIQVADGDVYAVSLGQRLIVKAVNPVINQLNQELNNELGIITAINTQNITLKQNVFKPHGENDHDFSNPECRETQLLTLHLYD